MSGISRLEEWLRKGYSFELCGGPCYISAEIISIKLRGGSREVNLNMSDFDEETSLSFDSFINLALDKWYKDDSLKQYKIYCHPVEGFPVKSYKDKCIKQLINDYYTTVWLEARTEEEATNIIRKEFAENEYFVHLKEI